jgi:hypothetical protein
MSITDLRPAPPENWGKRFKRCREEVATLEQVDYALGNHVSRSTLNRLEKSGTEPTSPKMRERACLVALYCGYMPEEFGLSFDDLSPGIDPGVVAALRTQLITCFTTLGLSLGGAGARSESNAITAAA